jgi:Mg-chelatase subunit ChlD
VDTLREKAIVKISDPNAPDYNKLHQIIACEAPAMGPKELKVLATRAFYIQFLEWFYTKSEEKISEVEADALTTEIIQLTREHPLLSRGASVRGTLALREISRGYEQLIGRLNRYAIEQSALIALPHRVTIISGFETNASDIIKEIILETLYGISFSLKYSLAEQDLVTKDSLNETSERSSENKLQKNELGNGINTNAFSLSSALRRQPEVQETLKKHSPKEGMRNKSAESGGNTQSCKRETTKDYLTEKKLPLAKEPMQEILEKIMPLQHRGRTKGTSGNKTGYRKSDYSRLKTLIDQIEKKEIRQEKSKAFQLHGKAIVWLLKRLVMHDLNKVSHHRSKREQIRDKTSVRRYMKGDTYKDISIRHTLKSLVRHGKQLKEVSSREFKSFEKKHVSNIDIVLCIDISESMKHHAKLSYARTAAAGIAKAAINNGERVGLVVFSNSATIVKRMTTKEHEINNALLQIRHHQYTNVGEGIKKARELFLKDKTPHKKQIIIISDGIPNAAPEDKYSSHSSYSSNMKDMTSFRLSFGEHVDKDLSAEYNNLSNELTLMFKELMGTKYATKEARKTREKNIEISFLYISGGKKGGELFAKKITQIGRGKFYNIKNLPDLPLKALELI